MPDHADSPIAASPTSAGIGRRLAALGYDAFLLFGLLVAPLFVLTAATHHGVQTLPDTAVVHDIQPIASPAVILIYAATIITGFYCYFWRKNGQTLGMQAWRLRLDSVNGGRPSWRQCGLRLLVGPLSLLLGGCGYWWIWLDRQHRSWHDRASGTRIVVVEKTKKG